MLRRPDGQLIDLGTLSGPTVSSWASGIRSLRGSIAEVGTSKAQEISHAFLIEPDGQVIDIGELVANAAREQFFLDRRHVPDEPSQWMEIRALAEHSHLGLFATGGVPSSANAVNDLDQVVGSAYSLPPPEIPSVVLPLLGCTGSGRPENARRSTGFRSGHQQLAPDSWVVVPPTWGYASFPARWKQRISAQAQRRPAHPRGY